jgi:anaerobic sulfite reductase subunit C
LGFEGTVYPALNVKACTGCGACSRACPVDAISVLGGVLEIERQKCMGCGECIDVCPTKAWMAQEKGVRVWVGGRVGRKPKQGEVFFEFLPLNLIPKVIESTLNFYRDNGQHRERFSDVLERVGEEPYLKKVIAALEGK